MVVSAIDENEDVSRSISRRRFQTAVPSPSQQVGQQAIFSFAPLDATRCPFRYEEVTENLCRQIRNEQIYNELLNSRTEYTFTSAHQTCLQNVPRGCWADKSGTHGLHWSPCDERRPLSNNVGNGVCILSQAKQEIERG